jgi:hypothetical protein
MTPATTRTLLDVTEPHCRLRVRRGATNRDVWLADYTWHGPILPRRLYTRTSRTAPAALRWLANCHQVQMAALDFELAAALLEPHPDPLNNFDHIV